MKFVSRSALLISACLIGIILSLLLVGVVSSTLLRHVVQVIPLGVAFVAVAWRVNWGNYAALPLFIIWFVLMLLIWVYLLNIAQVISGRFTPTEIICTVAIGLCCVFGGVASLRPPRLLSRAASVLAFILFAAFQILAIWLSFRPSISHR